MFFSEYFKVKFYGKHYELIDLNPKGYQRIKFVPVMEKYKNVATEQFKHEFGLVFMFYSDGAYYFGKVKD